MKTHIKYDLIIVGSGLVGTSLAVALRDSGLKILCLDRKPLQLQTELSRDKRPISLSYASVCILKNLGVWKLLEEFATPIGKVHVSNQGGFGRLQFDAGDHDVPVLGYVVPFAHLERALLQAAFHNTHLAYLEIKEVSDLVCSELGAELQVLTANGVELLEAQLVVAADGTFSRIRELLGIETQRTASDEIALSAEIHLQKPHSNIAYERFSKQGTFAILPSKEQQIVNLIWTLPEAQWKCWQDQSPEQILQLVQAIFGYRLGKMLSIDILASYPLSTLTAHTQIHPGAVLIGNAAHSFYPLAAQGFNLGLRDAAMLAECLLNAQKNVEALTNPRLLEAYQAQRLTDQQGVQNLTKALHEIFSLNIPGFNAIRSHALLGIDLLPPVKNSLAKRCLGFAGKVTRLARGQPWA